MVFGRGMLVCVLLMFAALVSIQVNAQVTGATLSGTVTDTSGGIIRDAEVSVKNTATGISRAVTVDSAGFYTVPNLLAGIYEVRVTAAGFSTALQSDLTLAVGAQQQLNFSLRVGTATETVKVTAATQIELTSSTLTGHVDSQTVLDLPLNGRDWTSLATLHPGVKLIENQMDYSLGSARGNRGFGAQLTVSGQRTTNNNYRLDGVSVNDYANSGPGNVIGAAVGVDAIQEFSVLTGGFSAEYGKATGGVINAITKSGTNDFHGDVYEFLRNSALDSRDYFSRSGNTPVAAFRRNQFGAAAGGPIIKDKTFIFGDYEGMRQAKGITTTIKVPSDSARAGTLHYDPAGPPPNLCTVTVPGKCTVTVDPAAAAELVMFPHATPGTSVLDSGKFINSGLQIVPENFYTVRVDHKLGTKDTLFGTYLFDDTDLKQPDAFNNDILNTHTTRQTVVLEESHTFGASVVNAARVGFSRTHARNLTPAGAVNSAALLTSLGSMPGQTAPMMAISGYTRNQGGVGSAPFFDHVLNNYQFSDDAFWTFGVHNLKFGTDIERMQYNLTAHENPGGRWNFANMAAFLTNNAKHFEAWIPSTITPRELRQTLFAGYVQDDWRFRPNLTLNLGLRYEMATIPTEINGRIAIMPAPSTALPCGPVTPGACPQPSFAASVPGDPTSVLRSSFWTHNPTKSNFEPRIGFAWDPFRSGKTAVRGSFGIFDALPLPYELILNNTSSAPWRSTLAAMGSAVLASPPSMVAGTATTAQGEWPYIVPSLTNVRVTNPINRAWRYVDNNIKRNYVYQYNLNIQRQITSNTTLLFGYTGSRGIHNPFQADSVNTVLPTKAAGGDYYWPSPWSGSLPGTGALSQAARLLNPTTMAIMYNTMWMSRSWYNAFQVRLNKQMSHGFQVQGSFTYSKSIDDASGSTAGDTFQLDAVSEPWYDLKLNKGLSAFDVRRNLVVNSLWNAPSPKSLGGFAERALGGWQLGLITAFADGVPATPQIASDILGEVIPTVNSGNLVPGCSGRDLVNSNYRHSLFYVNPNCISLVPKSTDNAPFCDSTC